MPSGCQPFGRAMTSGNDALASAADVVRTATNAVRSRMRRIGTPFESVLPALSDIRYRNGRPLGRRAIRAEERPVEEADHTALVLARACVDPAGVPALRDPPQLFGLTRGYEVAAVQVLPALPVRRVDEEHRTRSDPWYQVLEARGVA